MNTPPSTLPGSAGGVVVTYHPDGDFESRLAAIASEVRPLIVVDNSILPEAQRQVRDASARLGATLIANSENRGLAAALNDAFERHRLHGLTWAIAFDQDSTPEPGLAAALLTPAGLDTTPPAVVGSNWSDESRPERAARHLQRHPALPLLFRRSPAERELMDATCAITSGSLFHLPTWRELGGFDETLFLDLVDTDYCLRAIRAGRSVRVAAGARLKHRRGSKRPVRFLGQTFWPAFMPPLRLRYLFRNRVRLLPRHLRHAPHWVVFEFVYAAKILGEVAMFEDQKFAKLGACLRGTWDGMRGCSGKIE